MMVKFHQRPKCRLSCAVLGNLLSVESLLQFCKSDHEIAKSYINRHVVVCVCSNDVSDGGVLAHMTILI